MVKLPRLRRPLLRGWPTFAPLSSVRGRIIAGFGFTILILAGVAFVSAWQFRSHRDDTAEAREHATTASLIEDARFEATLADLLLERYVVTGNDGLVPVIQSSKARSMDSLAEAVAQEEARGDEDEIATLIEITAGLTLFGETAEEVIALRQSGDAEGARAALEAASPEIAGFGIALGGATNFERQEASALRDHADRTASLAFWLLVVSGVIGTIFGLVASALIARSILRPLSSLESAALAVAAGDLEARAPATGPRELARVGASFNRMTESLLDASKRRELEAERERAYAQLRESEERFRAIAEAAPIPMLISHLSDGTIVYANMHVGPTFGLAAGDMISRSTPDFYYDPADRQVYLNILKRDGHVDSYEVRAKKADGTPFWVVISSQAITFDGKPAVISGFYDITERKRAEAALRRWAQIFEHAEWGVAVGSAHGKTLEMVNPAYARMHGYTAAELTGTPIADVFAPDVRSQVPVHIHTAHEKGHYVFESKHIRKDGTVFPRPDRPNDRERRRRNGAVSYR